MVAKKMPPKTTSKKTMGKKITAAQDHKLDKKYGIKDGSPLDKMLDAKIIKKSGSKMKAKPKAK